MATHRMIVGGRRISLGREPGRATLHLDNEEIPVNHIRGEKPFSTPYLPHLQFSSLEELAKALIHHRFPGGLR